VSARGSVQPAVGEDEERAIRAQIETVCASKTFRRSEQSQKFLRYICDLALKGEGSRINEYLIGLEVFNRGTGYSTAEDAIVRRQAHTLRRKLDSYHANEGRTDRIRIDLPVGHYEPVFRTTAEEPAFDPRPSRRRHALLGAGGLLLVSAILAVGWAAGRFSTPKTAAAARLPAALEAIWGAWLRDPAGANICFANSNVALVHLVRDQNRQDSHPLHFRPTPDADRGLRQFFRLPDGGYLFYRPSDTKTSIAESISAVQIAELFGRWQTPVHATQSQLLNWNVLRKGNFVLLGHNEANPWVDKLLHKYPLRLGDSQGVQRYIENTAPLAGEKARYAKEGPDSTVGLAIEYALVSMLPGINEHQRTLLISGLDGQATLMATEYLTQMSKLEELTGRLKLASPSHSGPWQFQFIVRAEVHDRLATRAGIVALRVLNPAN
jgi:hypothetical protein